MMLSTTIPLGAEITAYYRIVMLIIVLILGWRIRRYHHWPIGVILLAGLASNAAYLHGDLFLAGLLSVPYVGGLCWVAILYMYDNTTVIKALLGAKESKWSRERHDLVNDNAALRAQLAALRLRSDRSTQDD